MSIHFGGLGLAAWLGVMGLAAAAPPATPANVPVEIELTAAREHADPFNTVAVDVAFTDPRGTTRTVPAFWAGGRRWKVRYASPVEGAHRWRSACSDTADAGLHGTAGEIQVTPYRGDNPLFARGPVRVAAGGRHLEHADGTPFFWLGDTWWMGLCHRLRWPDEFRTLAADRKAKGFNVVQIVAGLYPDMPAFDPRGANEAGFPWEKEYARIRPEYFDAADQRLRHLLDQGITPCIVGAWGYFLPWMGEARVKQHWRYLIARYGSWPVAWCAAGEANLPWYLAKGFPYDDREQVHGWTRVLKSIRDTDPFRRPLTIHPTAINRYTARHATDDAALLDFDMLQTPHGERDAAAVAVRAARESYAARPVMPVINGEAAYEMLSDRLPTRWTRAMFWLCVTNGTAGHTYGANGIWQCNRKEEPHGKSPHGGTYGVLPWDEAMKLPGSAQLGAAKRFLERYPWHRFEPHPDWVAWAGGPAAVPWGDWIWFPEGDPRRDAPVAARWFRRTFEVGGPIKKATLHMAADDAFEAFLNGREVGRGASWKQPAAFDVTAHLQDGKNVLAVRAENGAAPVKENPAGLLAALVIERPGKEPLVIGSDGEWRAAQKAAPGWEKLPTKDEDWPKVVVTAKYGAAPWGRLGDEDPVLGPQATGRPDGVRVVYALESRPVVLSGLTPGGAYRVMAFDPVSGETKEAGAVRADAAGRYTFAPPDHGHDWVLAVEPVAGSANPGSP